MVLKLFPAFPGSTLICLILFPNALTSYLWNPTSPIISSSSLFSAIEILDRVAVIVDNGLIMESQIKRELADIISKYE